ncbi:MAG: biotin/lipoyl-binding carrier protein [Deltaproteobacteria bacterium]|nr:MAG: biotin/lipoyl-binding carrier protein [Deltaproteobacteria bacterium]
MAVDVRSEITGNVWKVLVKAGDRVAAGDTLVILESMKMEIPIEAEDGGEIMEVAVKEGEPVDEGAVVVRLTPF